MSDEHVPREEFDQVIATLDKAIDKSLELGWTDVAEESEAAKAAVQRRWEGMAA